MKKILTASLVAMMAVTAARAEIASTTYVTNKVNAVNTALGEYKTANDAAVKKVGEDLAAETLRATGIEGGFETRIQALEAATGDGEGSVLADAKAYTDTEVGKVNTALTTYTTNNDKAVADMDAAYKLADRTLQGNIDTVSGDLAGEVVRATAAEQANANAITTLKNTEVKANADAIKAETDRATVAEGELAARIQAFEGENGSVAKVASDLAIEVERAKAAEQANANAIAAEATARGTAIEAASAATKDAYEAADAALKLAYEAADATLTQGVEANAQAIEDMDAAYKLADTGLDTRIQALETTTGENGETTQAIAAAQAAANKAQGEVDALEIVVDGKQTQSSELSLGSTAGAWQTLASINGYSTNCGTGKTCALSNVDGNISWVAVVNE